MRLSVLAPLIRRGINILLIFMVFYYFFTSLIFPISKAYLRSVFPDENAPTVSYGLLDSLEFVEKEIVTEEPIYVLNTKDGNLPDLPIQLPVYKYKSSQFSYSDGTQAQKDASTLGFKEQDLVTDLKGDVYRWRNLQSDGVLEISIHSKEIKLNTPLTAAKSTNFPRGDISVSYATQAAKTLFTALGRYSEATFRDGSSTVSLGRFVGSEILETRLPKDAQLARVDLFRKVGKYSVLGPDPRKGPLHVYLRIPNETVPALNYPVLNAYYWELEGATDATYPLVPIENVWKEVSQGKGVLASVVPKGASPFSEYTPVRVEKILVNNIYLAYYDTPKLQKHMQPIYVFEGNYTAAGGSSGSIIIYYPAISGQWVKQVTPEPTPKGK